MAQSFSGTIPASALQDVSAIFSGLYEFVWKGVPCPTSLVVLEFRQDLAVHKFADRDGAHVEATGRAPLQITAHIPFYNGISPGASESWSAPLYPKQWRAFVDACVDRLPGPLQHPELGAVNCKLEHFRSTLSADRRTGQLVECVWIESDDTASQLSQDIAQPSPIASLAASASDLDGELSTALPANLPVLPTFPATFTSFINGIKGAVDQVTLFQKSTAGQIDNLIYQCNSLQASLDRASSSLNWPMYRNLGALRSAAVDLKATLLAKGNPVSLYTVLKDSTLAQIAAVIPANIVDLMTLNRALVQNPIVPRDTIVRFYPLGV